MGVPVFAQFSGGLGTLLGLTGGYLISYPIAAGFLPFVAFDLVKVSLAALVAAPAIAASRV